MAVDPQRAHDAAEMARVLRATAIMLCPGPQDAITSLVMALAYIAADHKMPGVMPSKAREGLHLMVDTALDHAEKVREISK